MKHSLFPILLIAASLSASAQTYLDRSGWTWSASSACAAADNDIAAGLSGICDDNPQTCWHSNWHAASGTPERSNPHWVMIDRGSDRTPFTGLAYTPRQSTPNQACTSYYIYLSNTDLSSAPASSASDITDALGEPDASGSWEGSTAEKFVTFKEESTARYILFVNLTSLSSSSAACAEMNLLADAGGVIVTPFNAVRITPADGSAPHRIAVRGSELSLSMHLGYIRLSNSDITIEYSPAEISRFNLEKYNFGSDATAYDGPKKDILTSTFPLAISPAEGELTAGISEITLSTPGFPATRLNPEVTESIRFTGGDALIRAIPPTELPALAVGPDYVISGLTATAPGSYALTVPAALFIEPDGARSEAARFSWTLPDPNAGQDAIESIAADCPTLTVSHSGGNLTIGGITATPEVALIDAAGRTVMTARVSSGGSATLRVGSLPRGVYLLSLNQSTLKIIL